MDGANRRVRDRRMCSRKVVQSMRKGGLMERKRGYIASAKRGRERKRGGAARTSEQRQATTTAGMTER
jgi:hypothetical protein